MPNKQGVRATNELDPDNAQRNWPFVLDRPARRAPDETEGPADGGDLDAAASLADSARSAHDRTSGREGHGPGGRSVRE